jgi:IMP dehydrogenase/GMP reductase
MFAECEEACGYVVSKFPKKRAYYGMASEQGQIDMYGKVVKSPEGTLIHVEVNKTLDKFAKKFEDALRSAMSYTGCHNLEEFKHDVEYEYQTISEFKSYYKPE